MHHHSTTLESPIKPYGLSPHPIFLQNPRLIRAIFPTASHHNKFHSWICNCQGVEEISSVPKLRPNSRNSGDGERFEVVKEIDVATLGNLCVDIVLNVPNLPPDSFDERMDYMERLSKSPPDKVNDMCKVNDIREKCIEILTVGIVFALRVVISRTVKMEKLPHTFKFLIGNDCKHEKFWEAGGNCNMAIAAARLGLSCTAIGHVGNEIYGRFLLDVLHEEGIGTVGMSDDNDVECSGAAYETLLCWVLVDPLQRHGFCSRADFSEEPAFSWMSKLSSKAKMAVKKSKILFCNGYGFDELSPGLIISALEYAVEVGTSVFFDPGPRGKSLSAGTPEEQKAFGKFLRMSDVLLLTSEEAESLTGIRNPVLAGQELLKKGLRTKWVIVKMGAKGSILITMSSISCAPAFKVNVVDTVGCGDSFVAAIAFGFIHNMPTVNILTIANAVGAATAMGCGAGRNVATLKQVIELVKDENLNEDDKFWNDLMNENLDSQEIMFLSRMVINGSNTRCNRVPLQKVISEMLPILESAGLNKVVPS
ncbi:hypothetical protein RHMOL_Rhmol13G0040900 [Rhododendron molle]|uniref:Uncharacterized protein n=1 Tax=Rhododendron molle TaxID=49168 RepID=A0ACC0L474_RHOML|nr:hypothetical protein RHMOL_Rhmol13G0040900 [Rhododendron molle]